MKYYKPSEIAREGLLMSRNSLGRRIKNYESVLRIIREGKLKPKNVGKGKTSYWVVSIREIARYNNETLDKGLNRE